MKKILYFTDTHLWDKNPRGRTDNYLDAIMNKLMEIAEIANKFKPDHIIHGGDFFNRPAQPVFLLNKAIKFLHHLASGFYPIDVVVGNHEWSGRWEDWEDKSALHTLEEIGYVRLHEHDYVESIGGLTVHSAHSQVVHKPVLWDHLLWSEYEGPGDVFLCSDYHPKQGFHKIKTKKGRVWFISPGAIARGTATEEDMNRVPCVALITIENKKVDVKFRDLECAMPGGDILKPLPEKEPSGLAKEELEDAVQALKELSTKLESFSAVDVLRLVAKKAEANEEVVQRCRSRIER